jgi:ABC-type transporter Mla subunit MlaD
MSYDAAMKNTLLRAASAAAITLALTATDLAQNADTTTTIKDDAKTVGHAVANSARTVGHAVADKTTPVRDTIRDDSKKVGQAVAHSAKAVGAKAKEGASKVKGAVTGKSSEPAPKS